MPNHTTNQLRVTGPADSITRMREFAKDDQDVLSCQSIIPMPDELKNTVKGSGLAHNETLEETHKREQNEAKLVEKYGFDNWYDWCYANWDTKWGVYAVDDCWKEEQMGGILDVVYLEFQSAWSPPLPVIAELAILFPDLVFILDYSDEGGGYAGRSTFKGEHHDDNCVTDSVLVNIKNQEMGLGCFDEDEDNEHLYPDENKGECLN